METRAAISLAKRDRLFCILHPSQLLVSPFSHGRYCKGVGPALNSRCPLVPPRGTREVGIDQADGSENDTTGAARAIA